MPTQHTARRWMPKPGPARRDPPPTRRGEVQAALGKRAALGPHRGGQRTPRARAALAHTLWQVAPAATALHTSEGRRLGGPGTPRPPSQIAREGFLTEGASCPTHHRSPLRGPTGVGTLPKSGKSEGGGVCGMGKAHSPCERPRSEPGGQESVLPPGLPFRLFHVGGGVPRPESQTGTPPSHLPAHRGRSHDHMQPSRSREKHGACRSRAKGCPHWHTVRETHDKGST